VERLRIAIDQHLAATYGPEIHWTWRLLLTGIGWAWEEVALDSACDIAYVSEPAQAPNAGLCIRANPAAWARPAIYRLGRVERCDGVMLLRFEGDESIGALVRVGQDRTVCHRDLVFDVF